MANDGFCVYCQSAVSEVMDHVIPLRKGGRHHWRNLVPCCTPCNESKGDRLFPRWLMQIEENPKGWNHLSLRDACEVIHLGQMEAVQRIESTQQEIADSRRRQWFISNTWLGCPSSVEFIERWRWEIIEAKELAARSEGYPPVPPGMRFRF
ncbi:HNH endonuclease [Streptomyces buecherae]|uniref:HNH endonuclease n=1 Tax=Streptomyces buecherae TaxID=2763006 RepID=UPI0036549BB4